MKSRLFVFIAPLILSFSFTPMCHDSIAQDGMIPQHLMTFQQRFRILHDHPDVKLVLTKAKEETEEKIHQEEKSHSLIKFCNKATGAFKELSTHVYTQLSHSPVQLNKEDQWQMRALLRRAYLLARKKNEGRPIIKGSITIKDGGLLFAYLSMHPEKYNRSPLIFGSSHYTTMAPIQYGLDFSGELEKIFSTDDKLPIDSNDGEKTEEEDQSFSHVLFGLLRKQINSKIVYESFIKFEPHGTKKLTDAWPHLVEYLIPTQVPQENKRREKDTHPLITKLNRIVSTKLDRRVPLTLKKEELESTKKELLELEQKLDSEVLVIGSLSSSTSTSSILGEEVSCSSDNPLTLSWLETAPTDKVEQSRSKHVKKELKRAISYVDELLSPAHETAVGNEVLLNPEDF